MPTSLILTKITDHLSDISFSRKSVEKEITVHHTFKELIISGSGVDVSILDKKLFEVKLSSDLYSKALSADYFFSKQKTSNHFKCINSFTDPALPLSWLVVTLYYSCFSLQLRFCDFAEYTVVILIKRIVVNLLTYQ